MPMMKNLKPEIYADLCLPEGIDLISSTTNVFINKYNSSRKQKNHIKKVVQHLTDFYRNNFPDYEIEILLRKYKKSIIYNFNFLCIYIEDKKIVIAPIVSLASKEGILIANVLDFVKTNKISAENIISVYYTLYPKNPKMDWVEWRRRASENIICEGYVMFQSFEYYQILGDGDIEINQSRRRKRRI